MLGIGRQCAHIVRDGSRDPGVCPGKKERGAKPFFIGVKPGFPEIGQIGFPGENQNNQKGRPGVDVEPFIPENSPNR